MNETQFLGYLVIGIISLGSFVGVIQKFTKPVNAMKDEFTKSMNDLNMKFTESIHDLAIVMQDLKSCISTLKNENSLVNKRLEKHGKEIDDLNERVKVLETQMKIHHGGD